MKMRGENGLAVAGGARFRRCDAPMLLDLRADFLLRGLGAVSLLREAENAVPVLRGAVGQLVTRLETEHHARSLLQRRALRFQTVVKLRAVEAGDIEAQIGHMVERPQLGLGISVA